MTEVAGLGEAMALFQPAAGQSLATADTVEIHVAGAELNVCAAVARLGLAAALCSRVGADPLGERVLTAAARLGIDTSAVTVDRTRPTGLFLKEVRPDGQRRVHYYRQGSAASAMDERDAARLLATRPRLAVVAGLTAALGRGPRAAVTALVRGAAAAGTAVALDPNLRPALGPVGGQADTVRALLPHVRFLILGLDEAGPLFGVERPAEVFAAAAAIGVRETVLTAGADGCYHRAGSGIARLPSAASTVVDPVGAGDAFAGGYLGGRLAGASPAAAAWLGTRLAAGVLAAVGDTAGLPAAGAAAALLRAALRR